MKEIIVQRIVRARREDNKEWEYASVYAPRSFIFKRNGLMRDNTLCDPSIKVMPETLELCENIPKGYKKYENIPEKLFEKVIYKD
jgi:hypothetical protein